MSFRNPAFGVPKEDIESTLKDPRVNVAYKNSASSAARMSVPLNADLTLNSKWDMKNCALHYGPEHTGHFV